MPAPAAPAETKPDTDLTIDTEIDTVALERLLPPYRVVLHNDDVNSMDDVVHALVHSVPALTPERAVEIMLEAHNAGSATVIRCRKETAEHYRERIAAFSLNVTIEPD